MFLSLKSLPPVLLILEVAASRVTNLEVAASCDLVELETTVSRFASMEVAASHITTLEVTASRVTVELETTVSHFY